MICRKRKIIFVHIPKTGGTSVEDLFWPVNQYKRNERNLWMGFKSPMHNKYQTGGLQHLTASLIETEVGKKEFHDCFKFTFVRNPWDKSISQYLYIKKRKDLRDFIGMDLGYNFKQYLECIQKKIHVQWEKQYKFIEDDSGKMLVNWIGRFENISADVDVLRKLLNFNLHYKLPHVNKSHSRLHYSSYYDLESKEMVAQMYEQDILKYGYFFEDAGSNSFNFG